MPQTRRIALVTLLAALVLSAPSIGQTVIAGATPGGAFYTIAVPDAWNGGLVIYNHGFTLTPGTPGPDLGPLVGLQILEGYAVASSSYSQVGWAVFKTVEDNEELYDVFVSNFGTPQFTIVYGPSLGGLVTVQTVEQADVGNVVGAMPFCGAVAGSRNWHAGLDLRQSHGFGRVGALSVRAPGHYSPDRGRGTTRPPRSLSAPPMRTSGAPSRAASAVRSSGCSCDSRSAFTRAS